MLSVLTQLEERGGIAQLNHRDELDRWLSESPRRFYLGIDPTAASLHVGHLVALNTARLLQRAGHHAYLVLGGGTARVGDPSGKTELRSMLSDHQITDHGSTIRQQLTSLLGAEPALFDIVDNAQWLTALNYLDFLAQMGQHFSVNRMLTAECFKNRLEKGLSFLEFNYMLLQSYDFYHLAGHHDVWLQIGGDDQWSNMLAGSDLIRRTLQKQAYVLTHPLLISSSGKKMGKTESGAVWLDPALTSPTEMYQYFRNLDDSDIITAYRLLTDESESKLSELEGRISSGDLDGRGWAELKCDLAEHICGWVHGLQKAEETAELVRKLHSSGGHLSTAEGGPRGEPILLPSDLLMAGESIPIGEILVMGGVVLSKKEARRLILGGGLTVDGEPLMDPQMTVTSSRLSGEGLRIRRGKKKYYWLKISSDQS